MAEDTDTPDEPTSASDTETSSPVKGSSTPKGAAPAAKKPLPPSAKKPLPPSAKKKVKRSTADAPARYTAPVPAAQRGPSPRWVPIVMFGLLGVGLLMIILNYLGILPGSDDGGNGWYIVGGLVAILGGIITATQYR